MLWLAHHLDSRLASHTSHPEPRLTEIRKVDSLIFPSRASFFAAA